MSLVDSCLFLRRIFELAKLKGGRTCHGLPYRQEDPVKEKQQHFPRRTTTLINIWADAHIQHLLSKPRNKSSIWQKVSRKNYRRIAEQCIAKINNLKKEYRELKDRIRRSGEGNIRYEFRYFEALYALRGDCPSVSPQNVLDTSDSHHEVSSVSEINPSPMALHEIGRNLSTTSDENTDSK